MLVQRCVWDSLTKSYHMWPNVSSTAATSPTPVHGVQSYGCIAGAYTVVTYGGTLLFVWGNYRETGGHCDGTESKLRTLERGLSGSTEMSQISELTHRLLTAEARVCAQDNSCGICGGEKWHWNSFLSELIGFPLSVPFHRCSIFTPVSSGSLTMGPLAAVVPLRQSHPIAKVTVRNLSPESV
jgi:hypothetical protein